MIIVVAFRNAGDVAGCLRALADAVPDPSFEIFIAENGGPAAMDMLVNELDAAGSRCVAASEPELPVGSAPMVRRRLFRLLDASGNPRSRVHVAEMADNLGYAGGVNAWLRPLLLVPGWEGVWILNPDTEVTSSALHELIAYSTRRAKGMVGSRLIGTRCPDRVHHRGLAWRKLIADTMAVDYHAPISLEPDPEDVDRRIDAPSGASCYVTRRLVDQIGVMDERYFLFFEDLEWGCRAKEAGGVGYAHASVVIHEGGTTIGTAQSRAAMSPLAVYLEFRNRILFVRARHPAWLPWTVLMQLAHAAVFGAAGAFRNMAIALRGLRAGLSGEVGRPDPILNTPARGSRGGIKRRAKIVVSCLYLACIRIVHGLANALGRDTPSGSLVILDYHGVPANMRAAFVQQMDRLARRARVVPADWTGAADRGRPAVAITFDDAFVSVADNALPALAERGLPCTVFVPSGVLGRSPDWAMESDVDGAEIVVDAARLKQMHGPLVAIGAHSVSHPHLTRIEHERARAEIRASRDALAGILGCPVTLFAFPYGDYDDGVAELCRQEGFTHAFTITPQPVDPGKEALLRGRVIVHPGDGDLEFGLKMAGAYAWMQWVPALKRHVRRLRPRALGL